MGFYSSYAWKKKRREIREYYSGKCAVCGCDGSAVHHVIPREIDSSLSFDDNNLIFLCDVCHKRAHLSIYSQDQLLKLARKG